MAKWKNEEVEYDINSASPIPGKDDVSIRFDKFGMTFKKITLPLHKTKEFAIDLCNFLNIPIKKGNTEDEGD